MPYNIFSSPFPQHVMVMDLLGLLPQLLPPAAGMLPQGRVPSAPQYTMIIGLPDVLPRSI